MINTWANLGCFSMFHNAFATNGAEIDQLAQDVTWNPTRAISVIFGYYPIDSDWLESPGIMMNCSFWTDKEHVWLLVSSILNCNSWCPHHFIEDSWVIYNIFHINTMCIYIDVFSSKRLTIINHVCFVWAAAPSFAWQGRPKSNSSSSGIRSSCPQWCCVKLRPRRATCFGWARPRVSWMWRIHRAKELYALSVRSNMLEKMF